MKQNAPQGLHSSRKKDRRQSAMKKIRWGIVGPGWVANRFAEGLKYTDDGVLEAVVSKSSPEKVQEFARVHNIPKAYGNYEEFLADEDIDIVYVSILNSDHKKMVLDCFKAGKPVLCEKPFAINAKETQEMIEAAKKADLFLMEAMWSRFLPVMKTVRQWLKEGRIGKVKYLRADHGFLFEDHSTRQFDRKAGGGAMMDLGVYALAFASMVLGYEPCTINSVAAIGDTQVDEQSVITLLYPGSEIAILSCTMLAETPQEAWIVGDEGFIRIKKAFMNADTVTLEMESKLTDDPTIVEEINITIDGPGYRYEAEEAMRCLQQGKKESDIMPLKETLGIMNIMDTVRKQWGLTYPGEK